MTSDYERRADHNAASIILGFLALPVMFAVLGAFIALHEGYPLAAIALGIIGVVLWAWLVRFAGKLGRRNARKHRGGSQ